MIGLEKQRKAAGWPLTVLTGLPVWVADAAIRGYQCLVSPMLPPACRFWPTCSEYARLSLTRHGLIRGGAAAVVRLLRCQPFCPGGIDPPR